MAQFSRLQTMKLEKLFEMSSGYVLDFNNRTFLEFFYDRLKINIEDKKYCTNGESKAKRLRTFWKVESDYKVKQSILALIEYKKGMRRRSSDDSSELIEECTQIAESLTSEDLTETITELEDHATDEEDVVKLLKSIRESIEKNEPDMALDRLHTYCVKYIRKLCDKYNIQYNQKKPLHSCYGEYVKYLKRNNLIETDMSATILRNAISIFNDFNFVRNNKSYAHDNDILNYSESLLIYRSITSILSFIESIESKNDSSCDPKVMDLDSLF